MTEPSQRLSPCPRCGCHLRVGERLCPFCGRALATRAASALLAVSCGVLGLTAGLGCAYGAPPPGDRGQRVCSAGAGGEAGASGAAGAGGADGACAGQGGGGASSGATGVSGEPSPLDE